MCGISITFSFVEKWLSATRCNSSKNIVWPLLATTNLPLSLVLKRIFFFGRFLLLFPRSFDFIMMEGFEEDFNKEGKHRKVLPEEHSSVRFPMLLLALSYECNIRSSVFLCLAESMMMDSALMNAWAGGMFLLSRSNQCTQKNGEDCKLY